MRTALTDSMVERVALGERRRMFDSGRGGVRGLCLVVGRRSKVWALLVTLDGRQHYRSLGRWPALTVEEARARAREERWRLERGEEKVPTLGEALADHERSMRRRRSGEAWIYQQRRDLWKHAGDWFKRPITSLTVREVRERHARIMKGSGPYLANRVMRCVRAVVNRGLKGAGLHGVHSNPATATDWAPEAPRPLLISDADLPALLAIIEALPPALRLHRLLVLLTGGRPSAVAALDWSNVDLERAALGFQHSKSGSYSVPLCERALEELRAAWERAGAPTSGPVFPVRSALARRHRTEQHAAGQLRKLWRTHAVLAGAPEAVANTLANHGKRSHTGLVGVDHYVWLDLERLRPWAEAIAARVLKLALRPVLSGLMGHGNEQVGR